MADTRVEIPDREWFKPSEVCEIASVQPYVLRSWEIEFPNLGVQRTSGSSRLYRRADVERVMRIRQLVFGEGLTLAGVRRRIDGDPPVDDRESVVDEGTRVRLAAIRQELRSLHEWLSAEPARPGRSGPAPRVEGQPGLLDDEAVGDGGTPKTWPPEGRARRRGGKRR